MVTAEYAQPVPNDPAVIWARTVTPPRGAMCSRRISTDSPMSIVPSSAPSISSVRWARRAHRADARREDGDAAAGRDVLAPDQHRQPDEHRAEQRAEHQLGALGSPGAPS